MSKKYRIGSEITFDEDFKVQLFTGKILEVKKGDKAFLNSEGSMQFLTGEARGTLQLTEYDLDGYDTKNIAEMIYKRLCSSFDIQEFCEDTDTTGNDFIEEIENVLSQILY